MRCELCCGYGHSADEVHVHEEKVAVPRVAAWRTRVPAAADQYHVCILYASLNRVIAKEGFRFAHWFENLQLGLHANYRQNSVNNH